MGHNFVVGPAWSPLGGRRVGALVALIGCLCGMTSSRAAETQTIHTFERTLTKTAAYKYLLALPLAYDAKAATKRWPLLLFLHGSGERGDDVWLVATHGPPKIIRAAADDSATKLLRENFIVVSPQCPKGKAWETDALLALLDEISSQHHVDATRVYLTGLSMGGFGAWDLALRFPERFAAVVPICGGGDFLSPYFTHLTKRADLRRLGVWAFHGAKDATVPPAESERMINLLKRFEVADVKLTVYPEATHDSWTLTYANPEVYAWLLQHQRGESVPVK
jgi:predicted peptidase